MQTTMKDAIMMVEIVVDAQTAQPKFYRMIVNCGKSGKLNREHVQDVSVLILITILIVLIRLF